MKERSILFNSEMVRAILEGRKTQTRRTVKGLAEGTNNGIYYDDDTQRWYQKLLDKPSVVDICIGVCPYGKIGDRLWVRETWCQYLSEAIYKVADNTEKPSCFKWKSPIFMPRWASRITLEITDIRVERVQDIKEEDAKAEGVMPAELNKAYDCGCISQGRKYACTFVDLWNSINEKRGYSWEKNPWVWVISFKKLCVN